MGDMISMRLEARDVLRMLDAGDEVYVKAVPAAMNKAIVKGRSRAVKILARALNIAPQKVVARRMRARKAKPNALRVGLAMLVKPIRMAALANVQQSEWGVSAHGGRFFWNAFVRPGHGGVPMVFRRRSKARKPIYDPEVSSIFPNEANETEQALEAGIDLAQTSMMQLLDHELAWRMGAR